LSYKQPHAARIAAAIGQFQDRNMAKNIDARFP